MDWHAAAWANRLVENPATTPLLEITLGGLQLTSEVNTWIAITGANIDIDLDGQKKSPWSRFLLCKGQKLKLGFARHGLRSYLAVPEGFQATTILNSVATQTREKLGGIHSDGTPLKKGDIINCIETENRFVTEAIVPSHFIPDYTNKEVELGFLLGGDADKFSKKEITKFLSQKWNITNQSNRMGIRLKGDGITAPKRQWSLGVTP